MTAYLHVSQEHLFGQDDDDDGDNDVGFEFADNPFGQTLMTQEADVNATALDGTVFAGDKLVQEPRKVHVH